MRIIQLRMIIISTLCAKTDISKASIFRRNDYYIRYIGFGIKTITENLNGKRTTA